MTRYLLDTNIISDLVKPRPSEALLAWMAEQADQDLFIASLTAAEIHRGILEAPSGRRRDQLAAWFSRPEGPLTLFAGRVLPFDEKAALVWGRLMAEADCEAAPEAPSTQSSLPSPKQTPASSLPRTNRIFPTQKSSIHRACCRPKSAVHSGPLPSLCRGVADKTAA